MLWVLSRYGHVIAALTIAGLVVWKAYMFGVEQERAVWESKQDEITTQLRIKLRTARDNARAATLELVQLQEQHQRILADFETAVSDTDAIECVSVEQLRVLDSTIQRLRP